MSRVFLLPAAGALFLPLAACGGGKRYIVTHTQPDGIEVRYEATSEPKLKDGVYVFDATNGAEYRLPSNDVTVMALKK